MNIVIHVGLPKTGTTTIQDYMEKNLSEGYIGKSPAFERQIESAEKKISLPMLRDAAPVAPNTRIDAMKLKQWVGLAARYMTRKTVKDLVVSDEALSSRSGRSCNRWPIGLIGNDYGEGKDRPLPEFIKLLRDYWTEGEVKVVLGLRNQPEWLASLYSQRSYRIPKASQKNFEREVGNVLNQRGEFLEWNVLIHELREILGKENLKALLLEDINTRKYWNDLAEFIGIGHAEYDPESIKRKNVNSLDDLTWKVKKKAMPRAPVAADDTLYRKLQRVYGKSSVTIENSFAGFVGRGKSIFLSDSLLDDIWDRYRLSNLELGEQLNRDDLDQLGYLKHS